MRGYDKTQDGAAPQRPAYDKALALLARREHSRHELVTRLRRDGYAQDDIDAALDRLVEANYQNDRRFAEMLVRSRMQRGYGPMRLRAELKNHDLSAEIVRDELDAAVSEVDWLLQARAQLQKRYGGKPAADYAERVRRAQFLARRGFDGATARAAVHADDNPA